MESKGEKDYKHTYIYIYKQRKLLCNIYVNILIIYIFWRKQFSNFVNVYSLVGYFLPLKKGVTLYLNKLESPSLKDALCAKFKIGLVILEKKIFKFRSGIFAVSLLSFLGKGHGPLFDQTLIPFTQGCMFCAKFG